MRGSGVRFGPYEDRLFGYVRPAMNEVNPYESPRLDLPAAQILFTIGDHFEGLHIQRGRSR